MYLIIYTYLYHPLYMIISYHILGAESVLLHLKSMNTEYLDIEHLYYIICIWMDEICFCSEILIWLQLRCSTRSRTKAFPLRLIRKINKDAHFPPPPQKKSDELANFQE